MHTCSGPTFARRVYISFDKAQWKLVFMHGMEHDNSLNIFLDGARCLNKCRTCRNLFSTERHCAESYSKNFYRIARTAPHTSTAVAKLRLSAGKQAREHEHVKGAGQREHSNSFLGKPHKRRHATSSREPSGMLLLGTIMRGDTWKLPF